MDAVATVVTRSHLGSARALFGCAPLQSHHLDRFVCLIDSEAESTICPGVQIVRPSELGIANLPRFLFQYTALEGSCALKPFILRHLQQRGYDRIAYFDSDIFVAAPIDPIFEAFSSGSILLTPHLTNALPHDRLLPDEQTFLRAGVFNGGFVAVDRSTAARDFVTWWCSKTTSDCVAMQEQNLYVDQKWLDLVPGLFPRVKIHRNPGWNAAYWNLARRRLARKNDAWYIDDEPLVFFHFSGFDHRNPRILSRFQTRIPLDGHPGLSELISEYVRHISKFDSLSAPPSRYAFDYLDDGTRIKPLWREAVRIGHPLLDGVDDPFSTARDPKLLSRYRAVERAATHDARLDRFNNPVLEKQRLQNLRNNFLFAPLLSIGRKLGFITWK